MNETNQSPTQKPDRRETLREKKAAIEAQLARLDAAAAKEQRRQDTRRKIIAGAMVLEEAKHNQKFAEWLRVQLSIGLKQPRDRTLFGLSPLGDSSAQSNASNVGQPQEKEVIS